MSLLIVNPTRTKPRKKKATTKKKEAPTMAKKRKKITRNPSSKRKVTKRRRVYRNPTSKVTKRRRVHRNPSGSNKGLLGELMSKEGAMMIAAVTLTPTVTEMAIRYLPGLKGLTGYTRVAVKAGVGIGLAWTIHKYLSKKAGFVVGLVAAGVGAAEAIRIYQAKGALTTVKTDLLADDSTMAADAMAQAMAGYVPALPMAGYVPALPMADDGMVLSDEMGAVEPGTYQF